MVRSIWWTNRNFRNFGLNGKRPYVCALGLVCLIKFTGTQIRVTPDPPSPPMPWENCRALFIIYFALYETSSLNLKIILSKRVSFFVFLRCCILIRPSHGSRLSAIVRSDFICFYWNGWMKIDRSFWYTTYVKEKVKSTITAQILKSRHKPINKMDLQRGIRIALTEMKTAT